MTGINRLFNLGKRRPPGQAGAPSNGQPPAEPAAEPAAPAPLSERALELGHELFMTGNDQLLRASDNGTLVAFAALAFQQIRGKGEMHHDLGGAFCLLAVLMCAVVHYAIGNAYVGRAKRMMRGQVGTNPDDLFGQVNIGMAKFAAGVQFALIIAGVLLILPENPPPFVQQLIDGIFGKD